MSLKRKPPLVALAEPPKHPRLYDRLGKLESLLKEKFTRVNFSSPPAGVVGTPVAGVPQIISQDLIKFEREYYTKYSGLINMVLEDELKEVRERFAEKSKQNEALKQLISEGMVLLRLQATKQQELFNETVVKLTTEDGKDLPFHKFNRGDMVMISLSHENPLTNSIMDGFISEKTKKWINVVFNKPPSGLENNLWRIDKSANRVTFERMQHALQILCNVSKTEKGTCFLKELIVGSVNNYEEWASQPPRLYRGIPIEKLLPADFDQWKLNNSQRKTIENAIARRVALIQGPPGTGKTHTAVHLIKALVEINNNLRKRTPILCVGDTNVAIDNLLEKLSASGLNCLRVGKPVKIREDLRDASVEGRSMNHPSMAKLKEYRAEIDLLLQEQARLTAPNEELDREIHLMRRSVNLLENAITESVFRTVDVICATCIGAGHDILKGRKFPIVVIDEATQATEPSSLCALVKECEHLIMLGDHFQLPPTVTSTRAAEGGLGVSLYQRLIDKGVTTQMLQIQYRMHPSIAQFPNTQFYSGRIENGNEADPEFVAPKGFDWPNPKIPIAFVRNEALEEKKSYGTGKSKSNRKEAAAVLKIVDRLLKEGEYSAKDIGVLTPYSGQVKLLNDLMEKNGGVLKDGKYHHLNVQSIDGFQGREKEIIVFSTVRSNLKGKVGFLQDWRRLNVALTRARKAVIVIGNEATLEHDPTWKSYLEFIKSQDLFASLTIEGGKTTKGKKKAVEKDDSNLEVLMEEGDGNESAKKTETASQDVIMDLTT